MSPWPPGLPPMTQGLCLVSPIVSREDTRVLISALPLVLWSLTSCFNLGYDLGNHSPYSSYFLELIIDTNENVTEDPM